MEADGETTFVSFYRFFEFAFPNKKRGGQFEILRIEKENTYLLLTLSCQYEVHAHLFDVIHFAFLHLQVNLYT